MKPRNLHKNLKFVGPRVYHRDGKLYRTYTHVPRSKYMPHQGKQETARRLEKMNGSK